MKLNVLERLLLLQMLPAQGSLVTLKIVKQLKDKLEFTEDEIDEFEIEEVVDEQGGIHYNWDDKGNDGKEFEISDKEEEIIIDKLNEFDEKEKLTFKHMSIYEKFVEANDKE